MFRLRQLQRNSALTVSNNFLINIFQYSQTFTVLNKYLPVNHLNIAVFLSQCSIKSLSIGSHSAWAFRWNHNFVLRIITMIWWHTFPLVVVGCHRARASNKPRNLPTQRVCYGATSMRQVYRPVVASVAFRLGRKGPLVSPNRIGFHRWDHAIRTFVSRFTSAISVVKKNSEYNCNNLRAEKQHGEMNCLFITRRSIPDRNIFK